MFQDQPKCWITCYCKNSFPQCLLSAMGPLFAECEGDGIKRVDTLALPAPRKEAGNPPWVGKSGPPLTVSHNPT